MSHSAYDRDLDRNAANFHPLTPLAFPERGAAALQPTAVLEAAGKAGFEVTPTGAPWAK